MPRMANNCCVVVVPAVPIGAGACGVPAVAEVAPVMAQNVMPMNNCAPQIVTPMPMNNMVPAAMPLNNIIPSGTMPAGNLSGMTCNANFETVERVMEQPLQCPPTVIHHHNRVQHMVPCIKTNIHHVHTHHEWLPFEQREVNEVVNHNHGVRPPDLALCNSV